MPFGRAFAELGKPPRKRAPIPTSAGQSRSLRRTLNYYKIQAMIESMIAALPGDKRAMIPPGGTQAERIIAYALVKLDYQFRSQENFGGGRMKLGGGVIDFFVYLGVVGCVLRVNGTWWHGMSSRKSKDVVQLMRLRAQHYKVADFYEDEINLALVEGRLMPYVQETINHAA